MSHGGEENSGTELGDILNVLVKAPSERLLSLTFQLGESPEDNIIHALCLIVLRRETQALNILQALRDNYLAKHVAEKWQMSGGKLEDFATHCGNFHEFTQESLAMFARIFKVLSQEKLCDPHLRNLAYKRAISNDNQKSNNCMYLEYDQLKEEAKQVCGPQFAEWMSSPADLKSGFYCNSSQDEVNTTLKVTLSQDQSQRAHSLPSPLEVISSVSSYPTHLEISIPPTASFKDDKRSPDTSDGSKLNTPVLRVSESEAENTARQSERSEEPQLKSSEPPPPPPPPLGVKKHSRMNEAFAAGSIKSEITLAQTTKPSMEPNFALPTATNIIQPRIPVANVIHKGKKAEDKELEEEEEEEEEEDMFYAFVILHAPDDAEMADSMREKLESVIGSKFEGATFSDNFATPGKSTLRCVEDAINNTAFTILLLTRNFSARMQEMMTNSALINSIHNAHKYNTVIPLWPRENCMPSESMPLVLKTLNPLRESRDFERKILRTFSPATINKQRKKWLEEQSVKKQKAKQERLKQSNQHEKKMIGECEATHVLEQEYFRLLMARTLQLGPGAPPGQDGGDGIPWQLQPNIHINNARYIMIGNDSRMNVEMGASTDREDSDLREEEQ